ncbi:MAG: hypothetical protein FWC20_03525 [Oscillospiraceae bacterium]|nr:hypothetical protein [Oscillospiraceae bacterium]MCL2278462.1 hypothetical protein [Oscillospiraceae bacterium]
MTCKNCGFETKVDAAFCANCRARFTSAQYTMPPSVPSVEPRKNARKSSNTPIIVTAICAVVVVVIGTILAFTVANRHIAAVAEEANRMGVLELPIAPPTPAPRLTPPPIIHTDPIDAVKLDGVWAFSHGDIVFFFGLSNFVMFTYSGDNGGEVFESQWEEWGDWHIGEDGRLFVEGEWTGPHVFYIILNENTLTIIDIDGDGITYTRVE